MIEAAIVLMVVFTFSIISHCSTVKREPLSTPCEIIIVPPDEDNESVNESEDSGSDTISDTILDTNSDTILDTNSDIDEKIPSYFDIVK